MGYWVRQRGNRMLSRAISLACLAWAVVLAPASGDAAGLPNKAAHT
jgi:hypothetical protein